jgi:hypothetical protein
VTSERTFADGRRVRWDLRGFGADDRMCFEAEVARDKIAAIRHLFDRGDDEWMTFGEYPVAPALWPTLRAALGPVDFSADVAYFIGASQELPRAALTAR